MKALLISPDTQSTKAIDINGHDEFAAKSFITSQQPCEFQLKIRLVLYG